MDKIFIDLQKELDALKKDMNARGIVLSHDDTVLFLKHEFARLMGTQQPDKMN